MEGGISDYSVFNSFRTSYTLYRFATSSLGEFGNLFLNALLDRQKAAVSIDFQLAVPRDLISDCRLLGLEVHLVAKSLQPSDQFDLGLLAVSAVNLSTASLF